MTRPATDLIGQRFGKLTVLARARTYSNGSATWACRCDCGGSRTVATQALHRGRTRSCGCIRRQTFVNNLAAGRARANARKATRKAAVAECAAGPDIAALMDVARAAFAKREGER